MSTSRPSSRDQYSNGSTVSAPSSRRSKVVTSAQVDLSSMGFPSKPSSQPGSGTVTPTNFARGVSNGNNGPPPSHTNSSQRNSTGSSSALGYTANGNSSNAPPRLASATRTRSANSVVTSATFKNSKRASGGGGDGASVKSKDGGSISSDDDTVSEDSDRAGDDMQIFPGGQAGINGGVSLPFPGRQGFASGLINGAAPKITVSGTLNRHRPSTSMVGLSGSSSSLLGVMSKPIRIAAGAAMKIDSGSASQSSQSAEPATGANTPPLTSWKPNPPSSNQGASLSRQGSFRDRDDGSVVSMNSAISASTIRSVKSTAATNSAAAAANKAEENRRLEEAARTRRKIADLEISNSSLMDINRTLEATIRKQASEVQELKMKIQAAQFGELGYSSADVVRAQSVEAIELNEEDMHDDQTFKRLCSSIEQMVKDAKLALDQSTRPAGIKVLSLYELYEKEIAEDVDEDDLHSDIDHSFADNGQDNDNSIEVITQDDGDSNHEQEGLRNTGISAKVVKRGNRTTLSTALGANMIASTILDTPLTMVT